MKQVIIGDIHGRTLWKKIVEQNEDADRFIFIGDYVDTHEDIIGIEQLRNLEEICLFTRWATEERVGEVILLIGNHDFQYWPGIIDQVYSGYQPRMHQSFTKVFSDNKDLFQMCFEDEFGTVYTHAGLTETFVEQRIGTYSMKQVNDVFNYKPSSFSFYNFDRSGYGDDIHQSCVWVRPRSLHSDGIDRLQVVGHTQVKEIGFNQDVKFIMIDALAVGQYLVREDDKFSVKNIV